MKILIMLICVLPTFIHFAFASEDTLPDNRNMNYRISGLIIRRISPHYVRETYPNSDIVLRSADNEWEYLTNHPKVKSLMKNVTRSAFDNEIYPTMKYLYINYEILDREIFEIPLVYFASTIDKIALQNSKVKKTPFDVIDKYFPLDSVLKKTKVSPPIVYFPNDMDSYGNPISFNKNVWWTFAIKDNGFWISLCLILTLMLFIFIYRK